MGEGSSISSNINNSNSGIGGRRSSSNDSGRHSDRLNNAAAMAPASEAFERLPSRRLLVVASRPRDGVAALCHIRACVRNVPCGSTYVYVTVAPEQQWRYRDVLLRLLLQTELEGSWEHLVHVPRLQTSQATSAQGLPRLTCAQLPPQRLNRSQARQALHDMKESLIHPLELRL